MDVPIFPILINPTFTILDHQQWIGRLAYIFFGIILPPSIPKFYLSTRTDSGQIIEEVLMPVDTTDLFNELCVVEDQESLLIVLKRWANRYSIFDLVQAQGFTAKELKNLHPPSYIKELSWKHSEWLIATIKEIRSAHLQKRETMNLEEYYDFIERIRENLIKAEDRVERDAQTLYSLCAAYHLFITKTPVHMVGTPFPGGFKVQKIGEEYFCPVKEKQKDVPEALCKFCVAKQLKI